MLYPYIIFPSQREPVGATNRVSPHGSIDEIKPDAAALFNKPSPVGVGA